MRREAPGPWRIGSDDDAAIQVLDASGERVASIWPAEPAEICGHERLQVPDDPGAGWRGLVPATALRGQPVTSTDRIRRFPRRAAQRLREDPCGLGSFAFSPSLLRRPGCRWASA